MRQRYMIPEDAPRIPAFFLSPARTFRIRVENLCAGNARTHAYALYIKRYAFAPPTRLFPPFCPPSTRLLASSEVPSGLSGYAPTPSTAFTGSSSSPAEKRGPVPAGIPFFSAGFFREKTTVPVRNPYGIFPGIFSGNPSGKSRREKLNFPAPADACPFFLYLRLDNLNVQPIKF